MILEPGLDRNKRLNELSLEALLQVGMESQTDDGMLI